MNAKYPVYRGGGNGLEALNSLEAAYNRVGILEANQLNVTTRVADSALLPCMVKNLGQYTVSWLRGHDTSVLTFGEVTFSSDQRFKVIHTPGLPASNWSLQVSIKLFVSSLFQSLRFILLNVSDTCYYYNYPFISD